MWQLPKYTDDVKALDWQGIRSSFAWIRDMRDVPQDPVHHAEGDVEQHTFMVLQELLNLQEFKALSDKEKYILFAAALLHDVEKRSTTVKDENGVIVSPRHAIKGEYTARSVIYRDYPADFATREQVAKLVRYHGFPIWSLTKPDVERSLADVSLNVNTKLLYILAKADMLGRFCSDPEEMMYRVELFKELCNNNNCFDIPFQFKSDLGRYKFLTEGGYVDYDPFDDKKFTAVLMSGLPGAGKDTYVKEQDLPVVSIDDLRRKNKVKHDDKTANGQMIQLAKEEARVHMRKKQSFVWNATNITRDMRGQLTSLFMEYGGRVRIVYVETPYKDLLKRNREREHQLPEKAIERLIDKLEIPTFAEAHEVLHIIKS